MSNPKGASVDAVSNPKDAEAGFMSKNHPNSKSPEGAGTGDPERKVAPEPWCWRWFEPHSSVRARAPWAGREGFPEPHGLVVDLQATGVDSVLSCSVEPGLHATSQEECQDNGTPQDRVYLNPDFVRRQDIKGAESGLAER